MNDMFKIICFSGKPKAFQTIDDFLYFQRDNGRGDALLSEFELGVGIFPQENGEFYITAMNSSYFILRLGEESRHVYAQFDYTEKCLEMAIDLCTALNRI